MPNPSTIEANAEPTLHALALQARAECTHDTLVGRPCVTCLETALREAERRGAAKEREVFLLDLKMWEGRISDNVSVAECQHDLKNLIEAVKARKD